MRHAACRSYSAPARACPPAANIAPGKVVFEVRNAGEPTAVFGILQLPDAPFQRPGDLFHAIVVRQAAPDDHKPSAISSDFQR